MTVQIDFLKTIAYFAGLGPAELEAIKRFIYEKTAPRGEIIMDEGEPAKELYFLTSGIIKVFKTSADGKEQVLYLIRPGESFNDAPAIEGTNLASAIAMSNITYYQIKKSDMETVIRTYPQVALNTIKVLSSRVQQLALLVEDLSFRHVTSRVAKILLENAVDGAGQKARLTQQDMAAMAGTAREMVGRSLKTLEEDGTIRLDHHRIVITNVQALKTVAGVN